MRECVCVWVSVRVANAHYTCLEGIYRQGLISRKPQTCLAHSIVIFQQMWRVVGKKSHGHSTLSRWCHCKQILPSSLCAEWWGIGRIANINQLWSKVLNWIFPRTDFHEIAREVIIIILVCKKNYCSLSSPLPLPFSLVHTLSFFLSLSLPSLSINVLWTLICNIFCPLGQGNVKPRWKIRKHVLTKLVVGKNVW